MRPRERDADDRNSEHDRGGEVPKCQPPASKVRGVGSAFSGVLLAEPGVCHQASALSARRSQKGPCLLPGAMIEQIVMGDLRFGRRLGCGCLARYCRLQGIFGVHRGERMWRLLP
jgi:hypothetical protein